MTHRSWRMLKVGGSLFDLPDLPHRLRRWLAVQPPAWNVLVAGGGPLVDALRQIHGARAIEETVCHWLAIDLMDVTARVLAAWLPEFRLVHRFGYGTEMAWDDPDLWCGARARDAIPGTKNCQPGIILAPGTMLRTDEPESPGTRLPANWTVTSDSIAARLAVMFGISELVLFKSMDPPAPPEEVTALARLEYVDRFFPRLAEAVPSIRFENLRASPHF